MGRIRNEEEAEREASAWIARLEADDLAEEDRLEFEAWRTSHPQNARAYEAVSATWHRLAKSGLLVRAISFGQAMDAAATPPRTGRAWVIGAIAATLVGVSVLTGLYWWQSRNETLFQTATGETASVSLPDGSSLALNSNSLAKMQFEPSRRIIRLERGEAFFTVAHDAQRPFWVVAGNSWVRAVGTEFNVNLRPTDVEVTVNQGTVKVVAQQRPRDTPSDDALAARPVSILNAGDQADIGGNAATIRALPPDELRRSVAWTRGSLYFENRPLADVVQEMNRYSPLKLEIEDAAVGRMLIGGTFQANRQGVDALLSMLQEGLGLRIRRDGTQRVLIDRRSDHQQ